MNAGIWLLILLEPVLRYLRMRRGAKRYHSSLNFYDRNAQSGAKPSKLIKKHFDLGNGELPEIVYKRYIMAYIFFVRIFVLYAVAFGLRFNIPRYGVVWLFTTLIIFLIFLPTFIKEISVEHKAHKEWKKHRQKKKLIDDLRDEIRFLREERQYNATFKEWKWINALTKDLDRCTRKQRGKKYIPLSSVAYVERKILPNYQKQAYYVWISNEHAVRSLSVYAKNDQRLIYQVDIKK